MMEDSGKTDLEPSHPMLQGPVNDSDVPHEVELWCTQTDPSVEFICKDSKLLIDFYYKIKAMFLQGRKTAAEVKL